MLRLPTSHCPNEKEKAYVSVLLHQYMHAKTDEVIHHFFVAI